MYVYEIVKTLAKRNGHTMRSFSEEKGVPMGTVQNLWRGRDCKVSTLIRAVRPFGYDVVVVPKGSKLPGEHYVVSHPDDLANEPRPAKFDPTGCDELIG